MAPCLLTSSARHSLYNCEFPLCKSMPFGFVLPFQVLDATLQICTVNADYWRQIAVECCLVVQQAASLFDTDAWQVARKRQDS